MKYLAALFVVLAASVTSDQACLAQGGAGTQDAATANVPFNRPDDRQRWQVFVSDLHLGVGRKTNGQWHPTEDFRWPKALAGFLDAISKKGNDKVDLVIVGDFLEMWQPPPHIPCAGVSADLGCTLAEMAQLSALIVAQHEEPLAALRAFAERGDNRLHIVPGNHDSTLRYAQVWQPLGSRLNAASGRVNLVLSGLWSSPDGKIIAEHGHQIGLDVNLYKTWPRVVQNEKGVDYVIRPWGELFVQKLFNEQEKDYPIIDNLSPESAGARYRAADRGTWGSAADIGKFLLFNLLETSSQQQMAFLGDKKNGPIKWDVALARSRGADLFLKALSPDDPFVVELKKGGPEVDQLKAHLAALAADPTRLPDQEILHLCDLLRDQEQSSLCFEGDLGFLAQNLLVAKSKILARHLEGRQKQFKAVQAFVYGHTHQFEQPWEVEIEAGKVIVANTGAFQRLVSDEGFKKRLNGMTPQEGLRKITLEQLAPCYTAVIFPPPPSDGTPEPQVSAWHMEESGAGELITPTDERCR